MSSTQSSKKSLLRKVKEFLTPEGREIPDPTPIAPPVGFKPAPSLADQIREMVRSERLAREVAEQGFETFEEADDFDVGDDYEPLSPFEEQFDPEGRSSFTPLAQVAEQEAAANAAVRASTPPQPPAQPASEPPRGDNQPPAKPAAGDPQPS